ncbi:MAG: hypothetical protein PWQ10_221 [Patescibacteria group bacterium]|nr:hypothetical protein [Patescibacteria group bacterium]
MYPKGNNQKKLIKLIMIYIVMGFVIFSIVTLIFMFVLGYRFDRNKGQIEQYSFLQFDSSPTGATVTVNGNLISAKTPNKTSVSAGTYNVVMQREGYEDWSKTVDVKTATLVWLNYALFVPKKIKVEPVIKYDAVYSSLASPDNRNMIIQKQSGIPNFDLINLDSSTVRSFELTIPNTAYSEPDTVGVSHVFDVVKWDSGERYVLIKHTYDDKVEWLVMDTQNVSLTKNITKLFNIAINDIYFSGTNGNDFYVSISGNLRKLNLSANTMSRVIASNVINFSVYDESSIVTYISSGTGDNRMIGLYHDNDEATYILRTIANKDISLKVATAHYFNEDYVVISENKIVDILSGSYPSDSNKNVDSLTSIGSFESKHDIETLSFSPSGEYILVQSGSYFVSYDLEYQIITESEVDGTGDVSSFKWLDDSYIWSDRDNNLTIREFDGKNVHSINSVLSGQSVALAYNKHFLYSIGKLDVGYQLQRVKMILN